MKNQTEPTKPQQIWGSIQKNASLYFEKNGLPHKKLEDWKYLSLPEKVKDLAVSLEDKQMSHAKLGHNLKSANLKNSHLEKFFEKGFFNIVLSSDGYATDFDWNRSGISLSLLADFIEGKSIKLFEGWTRYSEARKKIKIRQTSFEALNAALSNQGIFIQVHKNAVLEKPLLLTYISNGDLNLLPRIFVECLSFSQLSLTERLILSKENTANFVSEFYLHPESSLRYATLAEDKDGVGHGVGLTRFVMEKNSRLTSHSIALSPKFYRHNLDVHLVGEAAEANCYGGGLVSDGQVVDHHTWIDHMKGQCQTKQLYKSILSGKSQFVFDGLVKIHKDAQKANSEQLNQNLILDQQGEVNSKPQLEIEADDVKAGHGSTIGQLDQDEIFYFESRAIARSEAEKMISLGFIKELTETVSDISVKNLIDRGLEKSFIRLQNGDAK